MATQAEQNAELVATLADIKAQLDRIEAAVVPPPDETDTGDGAEAEATAHKKGKH